MIFPYVHPCESLAIIVLKIDISKAYDRLEWGFIQNMMVKFRFHEIWVSRIMTFIQSVTYGFNHNGGEFGNVVPERGCAKKILSHHIFIYYVRRG